MGGTGLLYVPRALRDDPLWQRPEWARAYLDLQMRAQQEPAEQTVGGRVVKLGRGELWVSVRRATDWWQMGQSAVRKFLHMLHDRGLIEYPDGRENARRRDSFRVRLVHYWGAEPGARVDAPYGPRTRQKPNGAPAAGDAEEQGGRPAPPPEPPPERKEEPPVHRLMRLLVSIGLGDVQLKGGMWSRQAAVIKRLCAENGPELVERAIRGMVRLYPYSSGSPFDAFAVERRFVEALAVTSNGDGGAVTPAEREERQERAREEDVARRLEHRARLDEWRAMVSERLRGEPKTVKQEIWKAALDE